MTCKLIIGRDEDVCCRLVRERLLSFGHEVLYLPEDRLFPALQLDWQLENGSSTGAISFGAQRTLFNEIDGVLARFCGIATSAEEFHTKDGQYLSSEWHALMRGYMQALPCIVINRLRPELWYKMSLSAHELLSFAPGLDFCLPPSTITTSFDDARAFFERWGRRMRYSPITLPSSYFIENEDELQKLEPLVKVLPLCLTAVVDGEAINAYVVGDDVVFDGSSKLEVARHCSDLATSMGLTFCQFHLIRTDRDEWYCAGVECMPYLLDCPEETRDAVVERITLALCSANGRKTS